MNITRQFVNGKWEPPFTAEEEAKRQNAFAEMCESRQAPIYAGSERAFLADIGFRDHGLGDHPVWQQAQIIELAKRSGISVEGKRYFGGLADHRGVRDPEAWCASQQDYIDTAKRRDLNVTSGSGMGGVNRVAGEAPPPPDVDLAPDIVERLTAQYRQNPKNAERPIEETREFVRAKHGRRKAQKTTPFKIHKGFKDIESS